jgi:hypothetical protein
MRALDAVDIGMESERVAVIELAPIYSRFYFAGDTAIAGKRPFEPYSGYSISIIT